MGTSHNTCYVQTIFYSLTQHTCVFVWVVIHNTAIQLKVLLIIDLLLIVAYFNLLRHAVSSTCKRYMFEFAVGLHVARERLFLDNLDEKEMINKIFNATLLCSISTDFGPVYGAAGQNQKQGMQYRQQADGVYSTGSILDPTERNQQLPAWLERELLKQEPRRHSLALGDDVKLSMQKRYRADPAGTLCELKVKVKGSHLCSICCLAAFSNNYILPRLNGNLPQHHLLLVRYANVNVIMINKGVGQLD